MANEFESDNNKIGSAIYYFRENNYISQSKLCKGLCSVSTLSRIEAGERDVDSLLLEALLERLGKTPNQFELILTDLDYESYQNREEIKKLIEKKNITVAESRLNMYERISGSKGSVHKQFIVTCRALLNELKGGPMEQTIDLFMDAISYTVPDFKANKINEYHLSNTELNIIIDIIQRMISADMVDRAKKILLQVLDYLDSHKSMAENDRQYPKVAVIACNIYLKEKNLKKALELSSKGLDKLKSSRKLEYRGELYLIQAQTAEALNKTKEEWNSIRGECLRLYLQAYYLYEFSEEYAVAESIKKHLQEELLWEGID